MHDLHLKYVVGSPRPFLVNSIRRSITCTVNLNITIRRTMNVTYNINRYHDLLPVLYRRVMTYYGALYGNSIGMVL